MSAILEVTTGFSRSADDCRAKPGLGCVVSRREIRFVPHSALRLELHQDVDCNGIACDAEISTCVHGKCVNLDMIGDGGAMGGTCPSGRGPAMVAVGGYCIDSTEVTNAQHAAFLQASPSVSGLPPPCSFKQDFKPTASGTWPDPDHPQTSVDWCDAYAFCKWAGKRLCGLRPGAAMPARIDVVDKTHDEWYLACAGPSLHTFPYGNTYDPIACASVGRNLPAPLHVGSLPTCEGGYPGLFDMGGNAEEWLGTCGGQTSMDRCMEGQASFVWNKLDPVGSARCDSGGMPDSDDYAFRNRDSGIRCCADLL